MPAALPEIRWLANMGLCIQGKYGKYLVDPMPKGSNPVFPGLPLGVAQAVKEGYAPYDQVNLLLVTHAHNDHYAPEPLAAFALHNPDAKVVSGADVIREARRYAPKARNLVPLCPPLFAGEGLAFSRMHLTAVSLRHSDKRFSHVYNLAFVLREQWTLVHTGDADCTEDNLAALHAVCGPDALLVAPFHWFSVPESRKLVRRLLKPRCMLLCHLPRPEADRWGWIPALEKSVAEAKDPGVMIAGSVGSCVEWKFL